MRLRTQRRNANRHTERGMALLEKSIGTDGWIGAITVAADGETFDGSARVEVTAEKGMLDDAIVIDIDGTKPVVLRRVDIPDADDPRAKRLGIAANRIGQINLEWEPDVLAELTADADVDLGAYFFADELADLAQPAEVEPGGGGDDFDTTPDDGPTRAQLGDLWQIGPHRLLVGDCTDAANVARLMGGERADMVFTDPPYGVDYEGGRNPESNTPREKLAGDTSGALYAACMSATVSFCKSNAPWYIWFAGTIGEPVYTAVAQNGYKVRAMIVWNKLDAHYGNFMAQYMQKHEPCLYIVKEAPPWHGPTNEVTVWDVKQPSVNEYHPTQKPLELAERAIHNSSTPNALVCDFFLGSGTTLIAAHRTGRRCYGCELSPRYADVILRRAEAEDLTCERLEESPYEV